MSYNNLPSFATTAGFVRGVGPHHRGGRGGGVSGGVDGGGVSGGQFTSRSFAGLDSSQPRSERGTWSKSSVPGVVGRRSALLLGYRGGSGGGGGFGSAYTGGYGRVSSSVRARPPVPVVEIDRSVLPIRAQEKEEIKMLNNRFANFIDKVRILEQQNKVLEAQWYVLQDKGKVDCNLDELFEVYIEELRRQLQNLGHNGARMNSDLQMIKHAGKDFSSKYEVEVAAHKKKVEEHELVKKEAVEASFVKIELEAKFQGLIEDIHFLREAFAQELRELEAQIKNTNVLVEIDNRRSLDMDGIISEVRKQYEFIMSQSQAEAEAIYKQKFDKLRSESDRSDEELRKAKAEINDIKRQIHQINSELDILSKQREKLEAAISEREEGGAKNIGEAKAAVAQLEEALAKAKHDMVKHVRDFTDLMNIKLALDTEILTYRKLLEGEEARLNIFASRGGGGVASSSLEPGGSVRERLGGSCGQHIGGSQGKDSRSSSSNNNVYDSPDNRVCEASPRLNGTLGRSVTVASEPPEHESRKTVVIKTIETKNGRVVSESSAVILD
uniref:Keratin, type II cytoskeletal 8-like n=1 Tax=Petromyzon marinus TaxID=7757 RepID=A0AAJ7U0E7_PETMA|nr:keratin, type II cytoskeletal 8-like [Petromyzon marinus]